MHSRTRTQWMTDTVGCAMLCAIALVACPPAGSPSPDASPAVAVAQGIDTGLETVCKELETQPEPAAVVFGCAFVDGVGAVLSTFRVRIPNTHAPAFRARYVRPSTRDGGGD